MQLRDHLFLGTTQSLCPECLTLVEAKIVARDDRIDFRKRCPEHGVREDFVCSTRAEYDRLEFSVPGRVPAEFGVNPDRGCPYDCGLCTEHEQHTCVGLVEITDACNLECPMCYSASGPGGKHLSLESCRTLIDRLVQVEGRPEVLQLSGGEPTIHPEFLRILDYACDQPIDIVMINTNGVRLARDQRLVKRIAEYRSRIEVYLQFDGFRGATSTALRGEELLETKMRAVDALGEAGIRVILVSTLQPDVNDDEVGAIVEFGLERPWITGVSFQPATYSGRHVAPADLERRVTFPDVVRAIEEQTHGKFRATDFMPLPCAHPNCHTLTYAYRWRGQAIPLTRFIDPKENLDLLANGITFTRPRARQLIEAYLGKLAGCGTGCVSGAVPVGLKDKSADPECHAAAQDFFRRALAEELSPSDVFRITITSFLDAYNFDVRRLMKCCIHHVLPSGHIVPFCAYNVLYRNGHVKLPELHKRAISEIRPPVTR